MSEREKAREGERVSLTVKMTRVNIQCVFALLRVTSYRINSWREEFAISFEAESSEKKNVPALLGDCSLSPAVRMVKKSEKISDSEEEESPLTSRMGKAIG